MDNLIDKIFDSEAIKEQIRLFLCSICKIVIAVFFLIKKVHYKYFGINATPDVKYTLTVWFPYPEYAEHNILTAYPTACFVLSY